MSRRDVFFFGLLVGLVALLWPADWVRAASGVPICKDSPVVDGDGRQVIDLKLAQECQVPDKGIKVEVYLPGLHKAEYYPVEIRNQQVTTSEGETKAEFCEYQSKKACYYTYGLHEYIALLYTFAVGIIGIVSVGMIVFAAVKWVTAYGNATKIQEAKDQIIGSILGLVIALLSYVLLATINPAIVQVTNLVVPPVPPIPVPAGENECPGEAMLKPIVFGGQILRDGVSDPRVTANTLDKLNKAAEIANQPDAFGLSSTSMVLTIKSAHRTLAKQQELYDCYIQGKNTGGACPSGCSSCNEAAKPTCGAPHIGGIAVDACTGQTCSYLKKNYSRPTSAPADIQKRITELQEVFKKAGFTRYCGEWWHFESTQRSPACEPGQY